MNLTKIVLIAVVMGLSSAAVAKTELTCVNADDTAVLKVVRVSNEVNSDGDYDVDAIYSKGASGRKIAKFTCNSRGIFGLWQCEERLSKSELRRPSFQVRQDVAFAEGRRWIEIRRYVGGAITAQLFNNESSDSDGSLEDTLSCEQ